MLIGTEISVYNDRQKFEQARSRPAHWPDRHIGLVDKVFANGSGNLGPISGRVIPKTFKMVLDT